MKTLKLACLNCARPLNIKIINCVDNCVIAAIAPCVCTVPPGIQADVHIISTPAPGKANVVDISNFRK